MCKKINDLNPILRLLGWSQLAGRTYQIPQICLVWYPDCNYIPRTEGSGDVMVLRQSRPLPAARRPQWC